MPGYKGEMTNSHLRAAIRLALAARGLEFEPGDSPAAAAEQWRNGVKLRQEILAGSMGPAGAGAFQQMEPGFWDRIPLITDLGFRQTSLFNDLIAATTGLAGEAA
ncbi:MAG: hypothetical protein ABI165_07365, partial [Bryobacteraceae bacterium]